MGFEPTAYSRAEVLQLDCQDFPVARVSLNPTCFYKTALVTFLLMIAFLIYKAVINDCYAHYTL